MNAIVPVNPVAMAPVEDVWRMAQAVAQSGLFGMKSPEQAMALMLVAQAEGLHPATAARDYHVIQGRPALKADAMLARFMQAGGKVKWSSYTGECVKATFSHPQGGEVEVEWTLAQAKSIGLANKETWRQYPRQMLRARVVSEGIRTVFPGVAVGVYTPEEVADFEPAPVLREVEPDAVDACLEAPATIRKSKSEARPDYERLVSAMREQKSEADLKGWGAIAADEVAALPSDWQKAIRNEFRELLTGFKAAAQDKAEDPHGLRVPTPEHGANANAWGEYVDDVLRVIGGCALMEHVEEAERLNADGIEVAEAFVPDAITRMARIGESRIAELMVAA